MRAVLLDGPGLSPELRTVPVPRPRAGEALLRVVAVGVCHTDLQLMSGALDPGVWPLTPGHEIVGEVVAVEDPAPHCAARVGDLALVHYSPPCGECDWCQAGAENVCPNQAPQPGLSANGGYAELVVVRADCLVPLPAGLDPADAAPLGCAGASAVHAANVAGIAAGDTVAVLGVGGVGLALIQVARQRGARVLAVGRSPDKLALAAALGAEPVSAVDGDPVVDVRRRTGGSGVGVVFDLVGNTETLQQAVAMARRRGEVVVLGYTSAPVTLHPLHLVLRETRIQSSLGNTRAELAETVSLAARGLLRIPTAGRYPLGAAPEVLEQLGNGRLIGRAILVPALPDPPAPSTGSTAAVRVAAPGDTPDLGSREAPPPEPWSESAPAPVRARRPTEPGERPLEADLMRFVARGVDAPRDDASFNELALALFDYQYSANEPYRRFCERRGGTPDTVRHWRQIPAVPISAFKETLLACEPLEGAAEFNSSGTTRPEHRSRHFHPTLALYDLNARLNFEAHVLPDGARLPLFVLYPPRRQQPHSSLAHWLSLMVEAFGADGSEWLVDAERGLNGPRLLHLLRRAEEGGQAVGVLGASFGLVHALELLEAEGERISLPPGSRVMDTGGYKGRSREYGRDELYALVGDRLGVPDDHIVNMYGMTEHGTQFLDTTLRDSLAGGAATRRKSIPPWARTLVVDPDSLEERPRGERGLLLHVDLINRASTLAVLTEDVGRAVGDGFELLGRAEGSEARGCSIALDELLAAVGRQ